MRRSGGFGLRVRVCGGVGTARIFIAISTLVRVGAAVVAVAVAAGRVGGAGRALAAVRLRHGRRVHLIRVRGQARDGASPGAAVAFGLAALTRPEGILFFALTALHHFGARAIARRRPLGWAEVRAAGIFAAFVVPHFLWRRWYYGWWLPNTFYIKTSGGSGTWARGVYYLGRFVEQFHLWAVPMLVV